MKNAKTYTKTYLSLVLVSLLILSTAGIALAREAESGTGLDDDGLRGDGSVDDNLPSNSGLDDNGLRGDGSVDDNGVDSGNGVKTILSDGSSVEVGLGVPMNLVTAEKKNAAVQKALQLKSGSVQRVEVELEDGIVVWKVRIMSSDGMRSDIRVADSSGDIVRVDSQDDSGSGSGVSGNSVVEDNSGSSGDDSRLELEVRGNGSVEDDSVFTKIWKSILSLFGR